MTAFWNIKDYFLKHNSFWSFFTRNRLVMLHSLLDIPENEGDSTKLKKLLALVQHFSNLDIYVPKTNIRIDKSLINYEEEKREEEKLCSLYIQI